MSNNIQNALSKAKGDIIFLADQDDIWLEGRIDKVKKYFTDKQKPTVVVCDCTIVDANNNIIKIMLFDFFFCLVSFFIFFHIYYKIWNIFNLIHYNLYLSIWLF